MYYVLCFFSSAEKPTGWSHLNFKHQSLIYLPKRIDFHTKTVEIRMNLAVTDCTLAEIDCVTSY